MERSRRPTRLLQSTLEGLHYTRPALRTTLPACLPDNEAAATLESKTRDQLASSSTPV